MTDRFIDNFTPGDGSDGLTWAKAELTAAAVDAADAAGDRWLFDYRHSESTAGTVTLAVAGTLAAPSQLLSVTQTGGAGISSLTAGAIVAATGNNIITITGHCYVYGLIISGGDVRLNYATNNMQTYEDCKIRNTNSGAANTYVGSHTNNAGRIVWINCEYKPGQTTHHLTIRNDFEWRGGALESGSATPNPLMRNIGGGVTNANALIDGVDLSVAASSLNLCTMTGPQRIAFRNCKLPASWSGALITGTIHPGGRVEMRNCAAGDVNYALWVEDYAGTVKHETTLVKTGGASDGTTPLSWVMVSGADAEYPLHILRSPELQKWNETTGSAITVTVDFLHDSATNLQDDEIWLEVEYLGTSGFPLAVFVDDAVADVVATPADQTTSAATWTTTGMSDPNEQKLSVTFTPQEKGLIIARICVGLASKTVYVDPVLQVS